MDFTKFIDWGFMTLIAAGIGWMAKSVADLNIKMAVIIERTTTHEKELEDHGERIRDLERAVH